MPKTVITGNQKNNELSLNFAGYYDSETLMNVNAKITGNKERLRFAVNPNKLILNNGSNFVKKPIHSLFNLSSGKFLPRKKKILG